MKLKIFLFHRVSPSKEKWAIPTSPKIFEKCVRHITRHHWVRTIEDVLLEKEKNNADKNIACITFDDGFKDNIEYAAPILKKYNCPASFYPVTDCIDHDLPTWTHIYHRAFQETSMKSIILHSDHLPQFKGKISFSSATKKESFCKTLFQKMKLLPQVEIDKIMREVADGFNDVPLPSGFMMDWKDINELMQSGFAIGSHTKTHALLSNIDNDVELSNELTFSSERIRNETGKSPISVSYPVGFYNEKVKQAAKNAGYKIGLAVNQRFYRLTDSNFEVPRVDIYADSGWLKTYLRLNGSIELIKKFKWNG